MVEWETWSSWHAYAISQHSVLPGPSERHSSCGAPFQQRRNSKSEVSARLTHGTPDQSSVGACARGRVCYFASRQINQKPRQTETTKYKCWYEREWSWQWTSNGTSDSVKKQLCWTWSRPFTGEEFGVRLSRTRCTLRGTRWLWEGSELSSLQNIAPSPGRFADNDFCSTGNCFNPFGNSFLAILSAVRLDCG